MTWSPGFRSITPAPTSRTIPAPSWPRMAGNLPSESRPESVYASVWQTPVAITSTRTSPAFGPSRSMVSMVSGLLASQATAARERMLSSSGALGRASPYETQFDDVPDDDSGGEDIEGI